MAVSKKDIPIEISVKEVPAIIRNERMASNVYTPKAQSRNRFQRMIGLICKYFENPFYAISSPSNACKNQGGDLDGLTRMEYMKRLAHFIAESTVYSKDGKVTSLDFRPIFAANIHHLQHSLGNEVRLIRHTRTTSQDQMQRLQKLVRDYSESMCSFLVPCFMVQKIGQY
jgi:hypothetical protein